MHHFANTTRRNCSNLSQHSISFHLSFSTTGISFHLFFTTLIHLHTKMLAGFSFHIFNWPGLNKFWEEWVPVVLSTLCDEDRSDIILEWSSPKLDIVLFALLLARINSFMLFIWKIDVSMLNVFVSYLIIIFCCVDKLILLLNITESFSPIWFGSSLIVLCPILSVEILKY